MTTQLSAAERNAAGKAARERVPHSSHAQWSPASDRADPVTIIADQDAQRVPWLVPVRHQRMAESAFAFYRGAAAIMAADLAHTPTIDTSVQLCGDAHLANFGSFASPDRRQVFDVNDFDETLPGPWEWDVKRLAASFVLAARDNGFTDHHGQQAAQRSVQAYCDAMERFAATPILQVWYTQLSLHDLDAALPSKAERKRIEDAHKARERTSRKALTKLTESVGGQPRIRSQPPLLVPLRELSQRVGLDRDGVEQAMMSNLRGYADSISAARRYLLDRFRFVDAALKVVGVGSVGTRCFIALFQGIAHGEPLFLQVKEATESVLEAHLAPSVYPHHGQRVVVGQHLMQASSDIFLGWSERRDGPHYYWRQFHDMKGSAHIPAMTHRQLADYAAICGRTLAHAHARSGDAPTIHGYLGSEDTFPRAMAQFALAYADQSEQDYATFTNGIAEGHVEARHDR
jgi:uncharacterized protein (DUF2252 family)